MWDPSWEILQNIFIVLGVVAIAFFAPNAYKWAGQPLLALLHGQAR